MSGEIASSQASGVDGGLGGTATEIPLMSSVDIESGRNPCANLKGCQNGGDLQCGRCHLVGYCSRDCQMTHWPIHKLECNDKLASYSWKPDWDREGRTPCFMQDTSSQVIKALGKDKHLWGSMPAIDLFNIAKNEGHMDNISLCLAASGDIRNLALSFANLDPANTPKTISVVLNDLDPIITARNLVIILVLCAYEPADAAEMAMHLWYSYRLKPTHKEKVVDLLRSKLPVFEDGNLSSIGRKDENRNPLQHHVFEFTGSKVLASLHPAGFAVVRKFLDLNISPSEAETKRTEIMTARTDYLHRLLFSLSRHERLSEMKFHASGILLPFAGPSTEFTEVNPFFYHPLDKEWLLSDSASLLRGWNFDTHRQFKVANVPSNDRYGTAYFYIRNVLKAFSCHLHDTNSDIKLHIMCQNASALPEFILNLPITDTCKPFTPETFDRIEVSNISDACYLGIGRVLELYSPLLKSSIENPHATLLTLFIKAASEIEKGNDEFNSIDTKGKYILQICQLYGTVDIKVLNEHKQNAEFLWRLDLAESLQDFPAILHRYAKKYKMKEVAEKMRIKQKEKPSLASKKFPYMINQKLEERDLKSQLENTNKRGFSGGECYIEWTRTE